MSAALLAELASDGYENVRLLPTGDYAGTMRMAYTSGLFVGLDMTGYKRRYCYESANDALSALLAWDGRGTLLGRGLKRSRATD